MATQHSKGSYTPKALSYIFATQGGPHFYRLNCFVRFTVDSPARLDKFLAGQLSDHSRTKLAKLATEGLVLVNGKAEKPSFELAPGMVVELASPPSAEPHDLTPADIPLQVEYEDEYMLVVNKPRGLAVHPAISLKEPSLVNALLSRSHGLSSAGGEFRPGIVHRLDKDTTGLLIVAKNDSAHANLSRQIESKTANRRYVAVVVGEPDHKRFTVSAPIGRNQRNRLLMTVDPKGRPAVTHFKLLASLAQGGLLAASLETGRTHQIRVHLQSMGHPILGDRLYTPKKFNDVSLQLHAAFLRLTHPVSGEELSIFAKPPEDFFGADRVAREDLEKF